MPKIYLRSPKRLFGKPFVMYNKKLIRIVSENWRFVKILHKWGKSKEFLSNFSTWSPWTVVSQEKYSDHVKWILHKNPFRTASERLQGIFNQNNRKKN